MFPKTTAVLAFTTFCLLPAVPSADGANSEPVTAANAIIKRVTDAWNRSDGVAYGENYWPEAELGYALGNVIAGRSRIVQEHLKLWDGPFEGSHSEATIRRIRLVGSNHLLVDFDLTISWVHKAPPQNAAVVVKTHIEEILERRKGVWRILAAQNFFVTVPEPTAAP